MIYLDYSATTKIDEDVLKVVESDLFTKVYEKDLDIYEKQIQDLLGTDLSVIFTSGSTESNNYAIKGICEKSSKRTILTTKLEHSSTIETLNYLKDKGFNIVYIPLTDGIIDLESFKKLLTDDVCLVTIASVSSETGALQPISEIGDILKEKDIVFHCDMTQSIGKINIPFDNIDLASFSAHKFYGPKGIGCLLKKKDLDLKPLIYGKRVYNLGLINGLIKALKNSLLHLESKQKKVEDLYLYLEKHLEDLPNIIINKPKKNIPHILNVSVKGYKPETLSLSATTKGIMPSNTSDEQLQNIDNIAKTYGFSQLKYFNLITSSDKNMPKYDEVCEEYSKSIQISNYYMQRFMKELLEYLNAREMVDLLPYGLDSKEYMEKVMSLINEKGIDNYKDFLDRYNENLKGNALIVEEVLETNRKVI